MKLLSLEEVQKIINKSKIEIKSGLLYTIYECGHIFSSDEDPLKITYFQKDNMSKRTCFKCDQSHLVARYKKCGCGAEQIGNAVSASKFCKYCSKEYKEKFAIIKEPDKTKNKHLADPNRWNCKNRNECFKKYISYEALPCKNCKDYQIGNGDHDALYTTKSNL